MKTSIHAKSLSKQIHASQTRRFSGDPYFVHPERVANILQGVGCADYIISAAYLHDAVEDTDTTFEYISDEFGFQVAHLVFEVTSKESGITKYGKDNYIAYKVAKMSRKALLIKLADRIDNLLDNGSEKWLTKYKNSTKKMIDSILTRNDLTFEHQILIAQLVTIIY
jgi:(p)ppGpp synthase/HD superfamily hydrolase